MKKLIFWALVIVAGWYGWTHRDQLFKRQPGHDAVIENRSGMTLTRVRLTVDGQTLVKEELPNDEDATFRFQVQNDSDFRLEWQFREQLGEKRWQGGLVPRGPMVQRHIFTVDGEGGVTYHPEHRM
jgi:hypothetical protein